MPLTHTQELYVIKRFDENGCITEQSSLGPYDTLIRIVSIMKEFKKSKSEYSV